MSRTRRRLAMGRSPSQKMYRIVFSHEEARLIGYWRGGMVPWRWLPVREWSNPEQDIIDRAFYVHHEVFRNGSCRRQRIAGVRLTKQCHRRSERHRAKHQFLRAFREGEFDY